MTTTKTTRETDMRLTLASNEAPDWQYQCKWKKNEPLSNSLRATLFTVDVSVESISQASETDYLESGICKVDVNMLRKNLKIFQREDSKLQRPSSYAALDLLIRYLAIGLKPERSPIRAIKIVTVVARRGFAASANILQSRLTDHPNICEVIDFVRPGQRLPQGVSCADPQDVLEVLEAPIGAVLVTTSEGQSISQALYEVDRELASRVPMNWVLDNPPAPIRLALVEGRPSLTVGDWVFKAAKDLGINLVVLDRQGHWLQDAQSSHLREEFLAIDRTIDDGLVERIIEALKSLNKPVDGITTFSDHYLVAVAKVAELLNLPTSPPAAFERSRDKYESRMLAQDKSQVLRADTVPELRQAIERQPDALQYPLVVKPIGGYGSEGVSKVNTFDELLGAAGRIDSMRHGLGMLVETYVGGPEVDANFVLLDEEILFFEMSDDFPCNGDKLDATTSDHFLELSVALPTKLSVEEVDMTRNFLHQYLIKLGFRSGVFHVEARVKNSRMEYRVDEGTLDLHNRSGSRPTVEPSPFLIEVNARCPNMVCTYATTKTYGVNYYILHLLSAARDNERLRALSQSCRKGLQYHCVITMVPATRGGRFASDDPCQELTERCPELMTNISKSGCLFKRGDVVPDPTSGVLTWIAFFLVFSRISRADALEKADEVRGQFRYVVG